MLYKEAKIKIFQAKYEVSHLYGGCLSLRFPKSESLYHVHKKYILYIMKF